MKVSVSEMRRVYPKRTGTAITGWIPINVFNALEPILRPEMRKKMLRVHYRGPRKSNNSLGVPTNTRRQDATHAVIYFK